jgi:hypothetical protein
MSPADVVTNVIDKQSIACMNGIYKILVQLSKSTLSDRLLSLENTL